VGAGVDFSCLRYGGVYDRGAQHERQPITSDAYASVLFVSVQIARRFFAARLSKIA
jgi:hypothetical protein